MKLTNVLRIIGIIIVVVHLTYYFISPYNFLYFIGGFLAIYLFFVKLLPLIDK